MGEVKLALEYHYKALKIRQQIQFENHPDIAEAYITLAEDQSGADKCESIDSYQEAIKILQKSFGGKHERVIFCQDKINHLKGYSTDQSDLSNHKKTVNCEVKISGSKNFMLLTADRKSSRGLAPILVKRGQMSFQPT